jgi:predicted porin
LNSGWITSFVPPPMNMGITTTTLMTTGASTFVFTTTTTFTAVPTGFRTPALSTYVDLINGDHALNYFSPRFSGFQIGASYVPAATINGEGKNFPVQADKNAELHDMISVGVNFVESLGGVDVAVTGGYRRADDDRAGMKNPEQYSAGLNLGFAGFTVGGSIAIEDSSRAQDGLAFDAGATYSTGPWTVGATYFHSEVEGAPGGGDSDLNAAQGGIASGITASANALWADWDGQGGVDANGFGGVVGMKIGF